MAYQRHAVSQYKGRYFRNIGRVVKADGRVASKKFLLGTDRAEAELRNRLLEKLWTAVEAEHEECLRFKRELGGRLADSNRITGPLITQERDLSHGPVWRDESLLVADAVRQGEQQVVVQPCVDECDPSAYVERISTLQTTYSIVTFVPADPVQYADGQRVLREDADGHARQARASAQLASVQAPSCAGPMLHEALDAYAAHIREAHPGREYGRVHAAAALRLKHAHENIPLDQFGVGAIQRIRNYWAARPKGRKTGKPIALDTVRNQLKVAKAFIRWLHRMDEYEWSKPVDAEDVLRANVERLRSDSELAKLADGVAVWSIDELVTLYQHASTIERTLILLGLNCGFQQADIGKLRRDEIERSGDSAEIKRIRHKSRVYGRFVLWPETVRAIDWIANGRRPPKGENAEFVVLTKEGRSFSRQRIANLWNGLLDRVQKYEPGFRRLSFKYLRKTGGQLVRQRSNGEIAGVFLCHGQPVASDELSDKYTNRPYEKVAAALAAVHGDLRSVFESAPDAFAKPQGRRRPTRKQRVAANTAAIA